MEAYEAEQKIAVYPRVILCESAEKPFQHPYEERQPHDLLIDSDERVFIDYLYSTVMIAYPDDRPFTEFSDGHKNSVTEKLKAFTDKPYIRSKYEWAAAYHNSFCNRYPDLFGEDDKIPTGLLVPSPKPWIIPMANK